MLRHLLQVLRVLQVYLTVLKGEHDMRIESALSVMEAYGYRFALSGEQVKVHPPVEQPPESAFLLEVLRTNKPTVAAMLRDRQAYAVTPESEGDRRTITFDGADEATMKRWAVALEAGLIHLVGKVQVARNSSLVRLCYRCTQPEEWLQDAITAATKRQYNAILARVQRAEAWLEANSDDTRYSKAWDKYMALFEDLRQLYNASGEALTDPYAGYGMEAQA